MAKGCQWITAILPQRHSYYKEDEVQHMSRDRENWKAYCQAQTCDKFRMFKLHEDFYSRYWTREIKYHLFVTSIFSGSSSSKADIVSKFVYGPITSLYNPYARITCSTLNQRTLSDHIPGIPQQELIANI
ncbi:hypothetical protein P5673_003911 [Acropora cervicornis]|uniref:Uncharacterized protein n=1 Tax=Acropora cervicornis TaxID=6130 RepID=A0AAD9R207_ACRCE|nr:hypothetical protein P5673_003911 [Acropora cervicornis]